MYLRANVVVLIFIIFRENNIISYINIVIY